MPDRKPIALPLLYALVFASGMAGLVYQVVWVRMLSDALGVTVLAVVTVLGVFMGGLALGSVVFGRLVDRMKNPIGAYAWLEIGIGISAVLLLPFLALLTGVFDSLVTGHDIPFGVRITLRILYSMAALLLPTFLMGGTFPVLSRYLIGRDPSRAGRVLGHLYGVNTFGAMAGALIAGFVLIEQFGIRGTVFVTAALNGLVGVLALVLLPRGRSVDSGDDEAASGPTRARHRGDGFDPRLVPLVFIATLLAGFTSLGYEVFWSKALVFFVGNSTYSVSITLASFLFGIAFGSVLYTWIESRIGRPFQWLGLLQIAMGIGGALTVPVLCHLFYDADWLPLYVYFEVAGFKDISWTSNLLRIAFTCLLVMIVPTTIMGMAFPLATTLVVRARRGIGRSVGLLYAASTFGSILGTVFAGTLVIRMFGIQNGILALSVINVLVGGFVLLRARGRRRLLWVAPAIVLLLVTVGPRLTLPNGFLSESEGRSDEILYYEEGMAGIVKVYKKLNGTKMMSVDGGVIGASSGDLVQKQTILAHLPVLLAKNPKNALAVGLGSGITLGSLTLHDELERIDCVEIVPEVVEGSDLFLNENNRALSDPRVRILVDDGVNYLRTTDVTYDVISSDAKLNHAFVGNAAVYSEKYYQRCADRLTEGGIMCQWIPLLIPTEEWKSVARTFASVFPHVSLWFFEPKHAILVGSHEPLTIDRARFSRVFENPAIARDLATSNLSDPASIAASYVAGDDRVRAFAGEGPVNTFDRPLLEFRLPRALSAGSAPIVEAENLALVLQEPEDVRLVFAGEASPLDSAGLDRFDRSARATPAFFQGLIAVARTGQLVAGLPHFQEAFRIAPDDTRIASYIARVDEEEEALAARLATGGNDPKQRFRLGIHHYQRGEFGSAAREFRAAIALDSAFMDAWVNLGAALQSGGKGAEAGETLRNASLRAPGDPRVLANLAAVVRANGDAEQARALLLAYREKYEEKPNVLVQLAITNRELGLYDEAREAAEAARALDPGNRRAAEILQSLPGQGQR
ncbi:MAG: fused MFS/spermidine synthase [Gemmatimonadetes bacterium]|nr:fused MFS/spermidine synthase [Gemmatimonadota bacterium]